MEEDVLSRILVLKAASLPELQKKYSILYDGKKAPSNNKTYLWQRIAYRMQELEYDSLPDEAQNKTKELAQEYDPINNKALRPDTAIKHRALRDRRLPVPDTIITKIIKVQKSESKHLIKVLNITVGFIGRLPL